MTQQDQHHRQQHVDHQHTDHQDADHQHTDHRDSGDDRFPDTDDPTEFWDGFYGSGRRPWCGRPNAVLVEELTIRPLTPGSVLDLGSGSGADAIWFAEQGWTVTGVDLSAAALEVAADAAGEAGVDARISWARHDLQVDFPAGSWDLVVASYLHSPVAFDRDRVLDRAAQAVAPGGTLVILGHEGRAIEHRGAAQPMPTVAEVRRSLGRPDWAVIRAETVVHQLSSPGGEQVERTDHVLRLRRPA